MARTIQPSESSKLDSRVRISPSVPICARRQAAKAPDCKSGIREFESHRALQIRYRTASGSDRIFRTPMTTTRVAESFLGKHALDPVATARGSVTTTKRKE